MVLVNVRNGFPVMVSCYPLFLHSKGKRNQKLCTFFITLKKRKTACQSLIVGQDNTDMQQCLCVVSEMPEVVTKQRAQHLWAVSFTLSANSLLHPRHLVLLFFLILFLDSFLSQTIHRSLFISFWGSHILAFRCIIFVGVYFLDSHVLNHVVLSKTLSALVWFELFQKNHRKLLMSEQIYSAYFQFSTQLEQGIHF